MASFTNRIYMIRRKIEEASTELELLREGVAPFKTAVDRVDETIKNAGEKVTINPKDFYGAERGSGPGYSTWPTQQSGEEAFRVLCCFNPDSVRAVMLASLEEFYSSSPTLADPKRVKELESELRKLQVQEEDLITEALAAGERIARRPNADVGVILGL